MTTDDNHPQQQPSAIDRRDSRRYSTNLRVGILHRDNYVFCTTRDLCINGLSCTLPVPLPLFTKYRMRINLPTTDNEDEWIELDGIVVRVEEADVAGDQRFNTAVYFSAIQEDDRQRLEHYLEVHGVPLA